MKKKALYFAIVALLLLNMFTLYKLNSMGNNINNKFQQSDISTNDLKNDISNISANVEANLKKQGSILDNYNVTFGEFNPSSLTIPVTVSMTPKEYTKGLIANLQVNNKSVLMKNEGTSFVGTVDANIFDDFQLKVNLDNNGVKKIETIEEHDDLKSKYLLTISGGFSGRSSSSSSEYEYNGKIDLDFANSQSDNVKKISIVNDVDGVIISKREIAPSNSVSIDFNDKIKLNNGEKLTTYAMVQDKFGLNYKYFLSAFAADSNGKPVNDNSTLEMRGLAEISDKNGKTLDSWGNGSSK